MILFYTNNTDGCFWLRHTQPRSCCHVFTDLLTIPVNLAGLPGISIPAGFVDGLPVGLQLIGPKYAEETIYQAAAAFEAVTDYHKQQPIIFGGDK